MTFSVEANERRAAQSLAVAEKYFEAFAAHDAATMNSLYAEGTENIFQDPVFSPALNTDEARAMWQLLLSNPQNYSVEYEIEKVSGSLVLATWTARYTYSMTGQNVVNEGRTVLKVKNGKIIQQTDSFHLCTWFQMALPSQQAGVFCQKPDLFRAGIRKKLHDFMAVQSAQGQGH